MAAMSVNWATRSGYVHVKYTHNIRRFTHAFFAWACPLTLYGHIHVYHMWAYAQL